MTNTLTIETSGLTCSVAIKTPIIEKHKILAEPRSHGKVLLPYISELLNDAGIQVKDINTIGISIGPGSFTGLRIGFAITQGLARLDLMVKEVKIIHLKSQHDLA